ncbi:RDD family protein [Priestia megaterium]
MYCIKCGNKHSESDKFCGTCGYKIERVEPRVEQQELFEKAQPEKAEVPPIENRQRTKPKPRMDYAGFWLRAGAIAIDIGIVCAFGFIVGFLFYPIQSAMYEPLIADVFQNLIIIVAVFLYFSLMESSKWQATVGKKAVGLKVTDLNGKRISFGRATGRYFSKFISGIACYIGYIMVSFTQKKQGLHNMIAGTLVFKEEKQTEYQRYNDYSS